MHCKCVLSFTPLKLLLILSVLMVNTSKLEEAVKDAMDGGEKEKREVRE